MGEAFAPGATGWAPPATSLVGFNFGVEFGQLAFVAVGMPPVVWLAKPGRIAKLPQAISSIVAFAGAFWLVERLFFP